MSVSEKKILLFPISLNFFNLYDIKTSQLGILILKLAPKKVSLQNIEKDDVKVG